MKSSVIPWELKDATVSYGAQYIPSEWADHIFVQLREELIWEQKPIKIFGKEMLQPRLVAWYGDPGITYTYSGLTLQAHPWHSTLWEIKQTLENTLSTQFNSVLCNLYRDGQDSMGWHADDEPELGPNPVIASLSFGASRMFHLRHKTDLDLPTAKIALEHGSLLVMGGDTQTFWKHQLPKTRRTIGPRINLTFRKILS